MKTLTLKTAAVVFVSTTLAPTRILTAEGADPAEAVAVVASSVDQLRADTSTTTTIAGTVRSFAEDHLVLAHESSPDQHRFCVTKETTYVNEVGDTIRADAIRRGVSVTIFSTSVGEILTAKRVVLNKPVLESPADPHPPGVVPVSVSTPVDSGL